FRSRGGALVRPEGGAVARRAPDGEGDPPEGAGGEEVRRGHRRSEEGAGGGVDRAPAGVRPEGGPPGPEAAAGARAGGEGAKGARGAEGGGHGGRPDRGGEAGVRAPVGEAAGGARDLLAPRRLADRAVGRAVRRAVRGDRPVPRLPRGALAR